MTDTNSQMTKDIADKHNIRLVPLHVTIDGKSYPKNEVDLTRFYEQMPEWKQENKLPTTSAPSIGDFLEAYRELSQKAEAILYISYSPKLSMALTTALQAKQNTPLARCKTKSQTLDTLFEIVRKRSGGKKLQVAIDHTDASAEAKELEENALSQYQTAEVFTNQMLPVVTNYTGLGSRIFSWWHEG
jgi:fatty acid-binding protein DegV